MMTHAGTARGSVEVAVAHAVRLLAHDAAAAVEQAQEILSVVPGDPIAALVAQHGPSCRGDAAATLELLRRLCHEFPTWAVANHALGRAAAAAGLHAEAAAALQRALDIHPQLPDAWCDLADQLDHLGHREAAAAARRRYIDCPVKNPHLLRAGAALHANRIPEAESLLRPYLKQHPTDVLALRMLAEVAARLERYRDAEELLARCLELAPGFAAARRQYAVVLHRQYKNVAALAHIEALLAANPLEPSCTNLKAGVLGDLGRYHESIQLYEQVLARHPEQSKVWLNYGHALKTVGRREHSIAAYRRCIALAPHCGAAYWSLANLKTFRFTPTEAEQMLAQLKREGLADDDRLHLHFAIGKALEDEQLYAQAFAHYAQANRLRRDSLAYDPQRNSARVQRSKQLLTAEFFEQRRDCGSNAPDPIFIVGLPRAGSTLLEQILASHSLVEGTMELPDLIALVREVQQSHAVPTSGAPAASIRSS